MKQTKATRFNENKSLVNQAVRRIEEGINQLEDINKSSISRQELSKNISDITENISIAIEQLQALEQNLQETIAQKSAHLKEQQSDKTPSSMAEYKEQHESLIKSA